MLWARVRSGLSSLLDCSRVVAFLRALRDFERNGDITTITKLGRKSMLGREC